MAEGGLVGSGVGLPAVREGPFGRARRRGSSLVEMLIAIIVLVVVLMSMLGMVLMSRTSMFSKEDMTASAVARRILEECETEPFSTIADTGYVRDYTVGKYNAHVTVTSLDQAGAKVYAAKVMVELTWDAPGTGRGNVALERVISAGGHKNVGEFD